MDDFVETGRKHVRGGILDDADSQGLRSDGIALIQAQPPAAPNHKQFRSSTADT